MAVALNLSPLEVERVADESPELLEAMRSAVADRWTTETELLAGIYEQTHTNTRLLQALAGIRKEDITPPVRIPRPHQTRQTRRTATGAELATWVARRRGGTT